MKLKLIASFPILLVCACASISRWEPPVPKRKIANINDVASLDPNKKTVCSITLNSSDEIEITRKYLGEKHFNYIELVDRDSGNWFKAACESKVKCDFLVVSGHFGGAFFGDHGHLSLEELESAKCTDQCDGILRHPKEVFLYGCNTLAGKTRDSRTPEQYREVLLNDGFSPQEADQIVALRYSPVGSSFNARMQRVFDQTPRIYGFDSIAPSGQNIRKYIEKYFSKKGRSYSSYLDRLSRTDKSPNRDFLRSLSETTAVQTSGLMMNVTPPRCMLESGSVTLDEKLAWLEKVLDSEDEHLIYITEINSFFSTLDASQLTSGQRKVLERIRKNSATETRHRRAISALGDYLFLQYELVNFAYRIGWYGKQEFRDYVIHTLIGKNPENFDFARRDLVCSNEIEFDVEAHELPEALWNNLYFILSLKCLKPTKESIHRKLLEVVRKGTEASENAAIVFSHLKPSRRTQIELAKILLESEQSVAGAIAHTFAVLKPDAREVKEALLTCLKQFNNEYAQENCAHALGQIGSHDRSIGKELIEVLRARPEMNSYAISATLQGLDDILKRQPELLVPLANLTLDPQLQKIRPQICTILGWQETKDPRVWRIISQAILEFVDKEDTEKCVVALANLKARDQQVISTLTAAAEKARDDNSQRNIQGLILLLNEETSDSSE